jgi:hypothetical protein
MALDTALNTNSMGGIISDMTRKQVEGAEAAAGMKAAVAEETKRLRDPLLKEQEQAIGKKETQISSVGQEMMQPYVIPKETANDMATYGSMVGLIGVMLGASGKNSGMNTLSALTGLAKGYREGRKDLIDKSYKEFEVNQKRLQGLMQQAKTELDVIMQKYKVRDESVVQDIAAFEAKFANSIAGTIAKAQSADKVATLQVNIKQMEQTAAQHAERIKFEKDKYYAEQDLRAAQLRTARANALEAEKKAMGGGEAGLGSEAALSYLFGADAAKVTDPKERKGVVETVNAAYALTNLIKEAQDPDIKFGEIPRAGQDFENWYRRNFGSTKIESSGDAQAAVNAWAASSGLDPNDKNVIFYKKAIFTAMDAERAARGGSILPVGIFTKLTPLLDPKNQTREAFIGIFNDQLNNLKLKSGISPERYQQAFTKLDQRSGAAPTAQQPQQPKPMPDEAKLKGYAAANFGGDIEEAKKFLRSKGYQ